MMIDESTNISVNGHLVVFVTIIDWKKVCLYVILGLVEIEGGKKDVIFIFDCLITHLKHWGLKLCKFVAFGNDGASTMVGSHGGVATQLKNKVNPFLLSCHCVAHRTNLAALDASKAPNCKVISSEIDTLLNSIAFF